MARNVLDQEHVHPAIRETIANDNSDIVREVRAAVAGNDVVLVGMKPGDCSVFCYYGSVKCPPIQEQRGISQHASPRESHRC